MLAGLPESLTIFTPGKRKTLAEPLYSHNANLSLEERVPADFPAAPHTKVNPKGVLGLSGLLGLLSLLGSFWSFRSWTQKTPSKRLINLRK